MKYSTWVFLLIPVFILFTAKNSPGQSWEFVKEKDGIKIYTRKEENSNVKSFKGESTFRAKIENVSFLLGNGKNFDWWDKDIREIKVLDFQENKFIRYYLIYDVPWPLSDRDLVVEALISTDPVTGERTVSAKPLLNVVPEKPDIVRIQRYSQKWTVRPLENGYVYVILEGTVDPGGNVPAWLINMVITETPLKVIRSLRERAISGKPVKN
jgi:hypothetical protein